MLGALAAPGFGSSPRRGLALVAHRLGLGVTPALAAASLLAVAACGAMAEALHVALPEELLFRGALQGEIASRSGRPAMAILASAAAFAAAHSLLGAGLPGLLTFLPALGFGWLRERTGSVWPAVAAHAVANVLWLGWLAGRA